MTSDEFNLMMQKNKTLIKSFEEFNEYGPNKKIFTKETIKEYLNYEDKVK